MAGYTREEAAGIPRTTAERNYPDPLPKPELLYALTKFCALAGFRDAVATLRFLRALESSALTPYIDVLAKQPNSDGIRAIFGTWIMLPKTVANELVPTFLAGCANHVSGSGEFVVEAQTLLDIGERYPHDPGVLAAALLNRVELAPGQCLFQPAASPHAYLAGCGVELMANSDNVLRAGLTTKHIDPPELMEVLDFSCGPALLIEPTGLPPVTTYVPDSDFLRLVCVAFEGALKEPGEVWVPLTGPRIMLCVTGSVRVLTRRGEQRLLSRGQAVWIPASDGAIRVGRDPSSTDSALAFVAADGLDD